MITDNGFSTWKVIEYVNNCRTKQLHLSEKDKIMMENRLKENGWYAK